MTLTEALKNHLSLCDELYQLALEENRFLKLHSRVPDSSILDRKRALLTRLDSSLTALKEGNVVASLPSSRTLPVDPDRKDIIERARAKILQILHLDRENEQLLLRFSLGSRSRGTAGGPSTAAPSLVQRLYDRHT